MAAFEKSFTKLVFMLNILNQWTSQFSKGSLLLYFSPLKIVKF